MVWFIGDTQAHYDAAGAIKHVYSHLSMGTPVARVDRTGNATTAVEYQFHGLASNAIAAVAQGGTINASFSYTPFGEVVEATSAGAPTAGTAAHKRRFNDKFVDEISDLHYYGFRYYDKTLVDWTQADPLFRFAPDTAWTTPRRALLYSAHLNNPVRYIDPDGRMPESIEKIFDAITKPAVAVPTAITLAEGSGAIVVGGVVTGATTTTAASGIATATVVGGVIIGGLWIANKLTGGAVFRPAARLPWTAAQPPPEVDDDWDWGDDEEEPLEPVLPDDEVEMNRGISPTAGLPGLTGIRAAGG